MVAPLDILVATTLADAVRSYERTSTGASNGLKFEQDLYRALADAHQWRYTTPPDQYDLGIHIGTRTGTNYEHDGMFADDGSLYIIEAKWLRGSITREIVGIFVQKILDTLLGSYDDIGHFSVKPVLVSGNARVDAAAWRHAVAFGVLLITSDQPTPQEIIGKIKSEQFHIPVFERLAHECEAISQHLWRGFNEILRPAEPDSLMFTLDANKIYDTRLTNQVLDQWRESRTVAGGDLHLIAQVPHLNP